MKLVFHSIVVLALLLPAAAPLHAQSTSVSQPLTITSAIERARTQSFEQHRQNALIDVARARQRQGTLYANPSASYSREELRQGDNRFFEWTASVEYPLLSLVTRGNRAGAADLAMESATFSRSHAMNALRFDIQNSFVEVWRSRRVLRALEEMEPRVVSLEKASVARSEHGEISSYDHQRLRSELSRIRWRITEARAALLAAEAALARQLVMPRDSLSAAELLLPSVTRREVDIPDLVKTALNNRGDLKSLRSEHASLARQERWLRSMWMDDITIGGGYKQQSDNFRGPVLSVSMPLPIFDRNQGRADESVAEQSRVSTEILALEHEIQLDIQTVASEYIYLHDQAASLSTADTSALFQLVNTATAAYQEGEFSIVEYLDAVSMYMDGLEMLANVQAALLRAAFRLEYATGTPLFSIQEMN